ncbi:MAG: hypothetical protein ABI569_06845 [Casimicrobiaceae bacterium]
MFFLVLAVSLTAFALPASAAKTISLNVPSGPLTASTTQIQVTMNNTGNSNANSFEIDWIPSANFSVQGGFVLGNPANVGTPINPGVYGAAYKGLVWNSQAPNKTSVTLVLNVTVTPTCSSTPVTWAAAAWTGSPGPLSTSFTLQGTPYSTPIASLTNCLACNTATSPVFPPDPIYTGYFANLPAGVTSITHPGFAAGYRLNNDKGDACQLVDYAFTNNIKGTAPIVDANGNTLPTNTAALVWNLTSQPNAIFVYELTYLPEYVGSDGLPEKKTKFCAVGTGGTDCTQLINQHILKACIGTALSPLSIPGADPACILNETWTTVDQAQCRPWTGSGPESACVRATDRILDSRDPPIIRG